MATLTQTELERHLWQAADILRGTVDAGDYKQYIFGLLFYRRLCDVWDEARLQYTRRDAHGTLWQPYGRINLWHAFSGKDSVLLGQSSAIENRFGDTALEVGGGFTARVSMNVSIYGQASHRWTVDGDQSQQTATEAALGLRINW